MPVPDEPSRDEGPDRGDREERPEGTAAQHVPIAPRFATAVLTSALLSYLGITALNIAGTDLDPLPMAICLLCLVAIFVLQLRHSRPGADQVAPLRKRVTLGAQALLTYLPVMAFESQWGAMAGFLAGSLLLLLPPRLAWPLYGAVGLSMLAPPAIDGRPLIDSLYLFQSTLLTGLVVYGLSRLASLVRQLHETKNELARMAVTKERLRISRNLHDLLGYSLSAITLKSELIHRLVLTHPQRAKVEIEEVLALSRQSLADVRRVSRGLRDMSLRSELFSVTGLLEATDVKVTTEVHLDELGPEVNTVLAAVLREAITNMLRHSRATTCSIEAVQDAERVRLVVTNDGAAPVYRDASQDSGAGLQNLAMRLRSVSGRLTVAHGGDGTFRLTAEAPVAFIPAPRQAGGGPGRRPRAEEASTLPWTGPAA
ncbi:sensor histidine kinase [Streptomyces sp. WAC08241]|uniref:sensor histidine kinase n=1 Tax=Streptomyces sp. WAC08241 TaxID=2487421 RepID=UPI000F76FEF9|nr:histidine kinase [Streptomyces sp. WAC08241]MYV67500.1 two-component sensor histidine kinase [Streptomyces sp. SID2131]RSS36609.1 two-component sensor histidine kinase [Streptomyces sp. WAC08241]